MPIWIQLYTVMWIRVQLFTLMEVQIRILIKVIGICDYWTIDPPGLQFEPSGVTDLLNQTQRTTPVGIQNEVWYDLATRPALLLVLVVCMAGMQAQSYWSTGRSKRLPLWVLRYRTD